MPLAERLSAPPEELSRPRRDPLFQLDLNLRAQLRVLGQQRWQELGDGGRAGTQVLVADDALVGVSPRE